MPLAKFQGHFIRRKNFRDRMVELGRENLDLEFKLQEQQQEIDRINKLIKLFEESK